MKNHTADLDDQEAIGVLGTVLLIGAVLTIIAIDFFGERKTRSVLAVCLIFAAAFSGTGCRAPIIEVNRNAPLINVQDSANGNTVPVSAAP